METIKQSSGNESQAPIPFDPQLIRGYLREDLTFALYCVQSPEMQDSMRPEYFREGVFKDPSKVTKEGLLVALKNTESLLRGILYTPGLVDVISNYMADYYSSKKPD